MFGHGQIEGFEEKYGMEYTKAYRNETPDRGLYDRHCHDIFPLMKKRYLFSQSEDFLFYDVWDNGHVNENVFAYSNRAGNERAVVFYNNKYERASGWIKQSCEYAVKTGENIKLQSRSIAEGLGLTDEPDNYLIFREQRSGLWYVRKSSDICHNGLFLSLNGFESQVLLDIIQLRDTEDKKYSILCSELNGRGCYNLDEEWDEIRFKELYKALGEFVDDKFFAGLSKLFAKPSDSAAEKFTDSLKKKGETFYKVANEFAQIELDSEAEKLSVPATKSKQKTESKQKKIKLASEQKQFEKFTKTFAEMFKLASSVKQEAGKNSSKAGNKVVEEKQELSVLLNNALKSKKISDFIIAGLENGMLSKEVFAVSSIAFALSENRFAAKWSLARKIIQFMRTAGNLNAENQRWNLERMYNMLVLSNKDFSQGARKETLKEISVYLMNSPYSDRLVGANNFDNVMWFNKEAFDSALYLFVAVCAFASDKAKTSDIFEIYKELDSAQEKSEYKCSAFCEIFAPKKKAPAKKAFSSKVSKTAVSASEKSAGKKSAKKTSEKKPEKNTVKKAEKKAEKTPSKEKKSEKKASKKK